MTFYYNNSTMFPIFTLVFLVVLGASYSESNDFRNDYTYMNELQGGWFKFHRIPANWHDARLRCQLEGSVLASPLNKELEQAIIYFGERYNIYTGIHSTFSKGDYTSIEGVPLSNIPHKWSNYEPNNSEDSEACIVMQFDGNLADVRCNETYPYVCYRRHKVAAVTVCGTVDQEYKLDPRTGSCYKFHRTPRNWSRAFMTCHAEGGHLAIINSDTEAEILKELFANNPGNSLTGAFNKGIAHIGFHDWGERGDWRTIHGETLAEAGYDKFDKGQWDNALNGEFCGSIFRNGKLNDYSCGSISPFICEKSPTSLLCPEKGGNVVSINASSVT